MNKILDFLNSHASCRQFTDKEISHVEEQSIISTAQQSPTSSNIQAYSIVGVRNQETKDKLAVLAGNQAHVVESSLFLLICADLLRLSNINKSKGYPFHGEYTERFLVATVDASIVASRALMAAQALGYGGVMVGGLRTHIQDVSDLIELPDLVYPVMGISLGEPVKPPTKKPRLPIEAIYFKEKYDISEIDSFIEQYDENINQVGYLKNREVLPDKYVEFEGTYSWSEHTARRMANDNPLALRSHMLNYLQNRGFLKK